MYQWLLKITWHSRASGTFQHEVCQSYVKTGSLKGPRVLVSNKTERTPPDGVWKSQEVVAGGALLALHSVSWSLLNKGNKEHCQYLSSTWNYSHPNPYQDTLSTDLKAIPTLVVWFSICLDLKLRLWLFQWSCMDMKVGL